MIFQQQKQLLQILNTLILNFFISFWTTSKIFYSSRSRKICITNTNHLFQLYASKLSSIIAQLQTLIKLKRFLSTRNNRLSIQILRTIKYIFYLLIRNNGIQTTSCILTTTTQIINSDQNLPNCSLKILRNYIILSFTCMLWYSY